MGHPTTTLPRRRQNRVADRHQLEPSGVTLEQLRAQPAGLRAPLTTRHLKYADSAGGAPAEFRTPTGKVELCGTQHCNVASLRRSIPDPLIEVHPATAEARGIGAGDWVHVRTPHGNVRARAKLNPRLDPGMVSGQHGWWESCAELGRPGYPPYDPEHQVAALVERPDTARQRDTRAFRPWAQSRTGLDDRSMKKVLIIVNGPAYGADETFNAMRLALALSKRDDAKVTVFLMGDAVTCAVKGQKTPDGYYTLDRMLKSFAKHGGNIACCGTCLDARGLTKDHLIDEAPRSNMDELAAWTVEADDVLTF